MKTDKLTWNELAAALCKAGVIPYAAIDDAEGYDNGRTLDAVKAAAEMLSRMLKEVER